MTWSHMIMAVEGGGQLALRGVTQGGSVDEGRCGAHVHAHGGDTIHARSKGLTPLVSTLEPHLMTWSL